jgi:hypothetical protein
VGTRVSARGSSPWRSEDGGQLAGVDLEDFSVVRLTCRREHLLVHGPGSVRIGDGRVDAEVVIVGQVQRVAGVRGRDMRLNLSVRW